MIETCRRTPGPDFTARADKALNAGGRLRRLYRMMTQAAYPDWFQDFVVMEVMATAIQEVEVEVMPGLLQTEDYARAVLANDWPPKSNEEIDRRLAARVDRQRILDRGKPPRRDSKNPDGGILAVTERSWHDFVSAIRSGVVGGQ